VSVGFGRSAALIEARYAGFRPRVGSRVQQNVSGPSGRPAPIAWTASALKGVCAMGRPSSRFAPRSTAPANIAWHASGRNAGVVPRLNRPAPAWAPSPLLTSSERIAPPLGLPGQTQALIEFEPGYPVALQPESGGTISRDVPGSGPSERNLHVKLNQILDFRGASRWSRKCRVVGGAGV
jgi:hypothetical protein